MTATALLHAHGVQVARYPDGGLKLAGLGSLPPEEARRLVAYARAHKAEILAEMKAEEEHPAERYAQGCPKYWAACLQCPDAGLGSLYFCKRLRTPEGGWRQ